LKFLYEDDLSDEDDSYDEVDSFDDDFNFQFCNMLVSKYISSLPNKGSLRMHPYSHIGHLEEFKDGMFSDAIEGEPSYLEEITPTFSPSIPTLDVSFEPIFQPILDPNKSSYAFSPKSHDDPRNQLRQSNHRSHDDCQEKQRLWQECLEYAKSTYAIVEEWMDEDEALYETNPRDSNPWEILDNKTSNHCSSKRPFSPFKHCLNGKQKSAVLFRP
jgi:hypothetical protein